MQATHPLELGEIQEPALAEYQPLGMEALARLFAMVSGTLVLVLGLAKFARKHRDLRPLTTSHRW